METLQLLEGSLLHFLEVLVLSGVKFVLAPALSMGLGFSYLQTIIVTSIGGLAGFYFFYYLSEWLINYYYKHIYPLLPVRKKIKPEYIIASKTFNPRKKKKSFTFLNKTIVRTRGAFGITGIALLTPVLLSIPIGAFIVNKYYKNNHRKFVYLSVSILIWSLVVSSLMFVFKNPLTSAFH